MRNLMILASGAALAAIGAAAAAQDGERAFAVGAFDEISAEGPHRIVVTVGGARAVRASGAAETLDKLEAVVEGDELHIRPKKEYRRNFSWRGLPPATFHVSVPALEGVSLAGSGGMTVDRVRGNHFEAALAGSGGLEIGNLDVSEASFSIAGSGGLSVSGRAGTAAVALAGSGDMKGRGLASRIAEVTIAGSGGVELSAGEAASVSIVGSGGAEIGGTATCSVSRIGSGRVRCGA